MAEKYQGRRVVRFTVPVTLHIDGKELTQWLQQSGELSDQEDTAVSFAMFASSTPREQAQILKRCHSLFGFDEWMDLQYGIERTQEALRNRLIAELWPGGRPEALGKALAEQDAMLAAAFDADRSREKLGWQELVRMNDRIEFYAKWEVLGVEHPDGWAKIVDREMGPRVFIALWNAYSDALNEVVLGKAEPSAS